MENIHLIKAVLPDSIAEELEIKPNSRLLSVNGMPVKDIFDYQFLITDDYVELDIEEPDGEITTYEIEKDFNEDIGLVFETSLMDEYHSCTNKCIFCFIDQMPKGMRETLYFKDDDSRLSFLQGNYITLTNMKEEDIDRIIRYRMEPINISVHTMNPELRCKMLNNRFAGDVLKYIKKLSDADIQMNCQIVLCKGINDGDELKSTIEKLYEYAPSVRSISVVPSGLTKYRENLFPLECFEKEDAKKVIDIIENYQKKIYNKDGIHFIHASDEFYFLAEKDMPEEERYDGYSQLENGVGMVRLLLNEFKEAKEKRKELSAKEKVSLATGKLMENLLREMLCEFGVNVYGIENEFFGENVTVSGLVTGGDLINQLKGKDLGKKLLLPINMFRQGEEYFLDDVTKEEVEKALNIEVVIVPQGGENLLKAALGEPLDDKKRQIYELENLDGK